MWANRLRHRTYRNLHVTVDGTDCRIVEPTPFSSDWYSHKFHGPGLRYEVAVSLDGGHIVWTNGPFPCGLYPDQKIFNNDLKNMLLQDEYVIADKGYGGPRVVHDINGNYELAATLLARHESANMRLKCFKIVGGVFRHDLALHSYCFRAVSNLVQLTLQSTNPLFSAPVQ